MATYKVIQDIEADDHLIGNLSFRQFVYALIAVFMLYISYIGLTKHAAAILVFTAPVALFTGFLAYPFGKDQPTEVWALARLRFLIKPRRRIWAQSGVKELVTITVPKKVEIDRTDGLSQNEVRSRLQALADTIDSRGWAVKNAGDVYQNPIAITPDSDRLVSASSVPQSVPDYNITDSDDVLDVAANPAAQQMDQLLNASGEYHRQQLMQELSDIGQAQASTQPVAPVMIQTPAPTQIPSPMTYPAASTGVAMDDASLLDELKTLNASQQSSLNNMRTLRPVASQPSTDATPLSAPVINPISNNTATVNPAPQTASTKPLDPVIMNLAQRNDLNVTVIANEANKAKATKPNSASNDEVLISLH